MEEPALRLERTIGRVLARDSLGQLFPKTILKTRSPKTKTGSKPRTS